MAATAPTRLGPYKIISLIGKGGMGEVYRAHDPRLGRDVAVKVSAAQFTERFAREARALAAFNHPKICQLYDVGPNYLVMELIDGAPLKGPLPVEKAVEYAGQILDALDAAHRKGFTHRDLKPANILVTKQGIKLLDFGLAKQATSLGPDDRTFAAVTAEGQITGTLMYMSPEQLQGKEVDARSDIFSFGCVLYEMLSGSRAFGGTNAASVIAAILEREPEPLKSAPPMDRVIRRCLAKDPEERFQTVRDLKYNLGLAGQSGPSGIAPSRSRLGSSPWISAAAGLAIVAAALGFQLYRATRPVELKPLVRLDVDLGPDVALLSQRGWGAIISPGADRLVYVSQNRLFTRRLDQMKATELVGTEGATEPFFSPDGQWVAFFAQGKLKKISVEGGAAINLCNIVLSNGGSWGEDGNIVAALNSHNGLMRLSSAGGKPTPLTELEEGEYTHRWPQALPGGKAVLFTSGASAVGDFNIQVVSVADRHKKTLVRGGTFGRYLPGGYLVYMNGGTLFAVLFDLDKLEVRGTPTPVLEQISTSPFGWAQLDFSRTGTLLYRSAGSSGGLVTIQWLDSGGNAQPLLSKPATYSRLTVSPDGSRLAFMGTADTWVYEWQRDIMTRLKTNSVLERSPVWNPDGRYLTFGAAGGGMYWTRSDGPDTSQLLTQSKHTENPNSFTPDGKRLAFTEEVSTSTGYDIFTLPVENDGNRLRSGKPEPFLQTPANESDASFSADGRWLAYQSDETGQYEVYVRSFPDKGARWQISNNGGFFPQFSPKGRELFYRTEDNQVMVARWTVKGDSFVAEKPRIWTERRLANVGQVKNYDVAPDGKRIAAIMAAEGSDEERAQTHVIFLENFFDELRRKVPPNK